MKERLYQGGEDEKKKWQRKIHQDRYEKLKMQQGKASLKGKN